MNTRSISTIARALVTAGFALIVAACVAPVGSDGNAGEKATEEALPQKCPGGDRFLHCPSAGGFGSSVFERGLAALHCSGKFVAQGTGQGHSAIYQTLCSVSAQARFGCGTTGGIDQLIACTMGTKDLDAALESTSGCGCSLPAPAGFVYVLWDPTCSSGGCVPTSW